MTREDLSAYYQYALKHREDHKCAAVPYQEGEWLTSFVRTKKPKNVLEVGTGVGYSTACLLMGNKDAHIDTIDKDNEHIILAKKYWEELGVEKKITVYSEKIENFLPTLSSSYDLIFYDGYVPQKKLVNQFYSILQPRGVLITANLFLADPHGGRYVQILNDKTQWRTNIFADTAISIKQ